MSRDAKATLDYVKFAQELRKTGTIVGTNKTNDNRIGDWVVHNCDKVWLDGHFDYWAWNPYFDGVWDR